MPVDMMDSAIDDLQLDQTAADDQQQVADDAAVVDANPDGDKQQAAPVVGDERTLPKWIRNLKVSDPGSYTTAKDHFFTQKTLQDKLKDFDLDGTKTWLTEAGGRETIEGRIQELDAKAQELDTLLGDVAQGNPAIADRLFEAAGPKGGDIARAVMSQYAQKDPDGWNDVLTPVFAATIMQGQVLGLDGKTPTTLPDMLKEVDYAMRFAQTPEQKAEFATNALKSVTQFLAGFTNAQPKAPGQASPKQMSAIEEREKALNDRETAQFTSGVTSALGSEMKSDIEAALKEYISRAPDDKDKRELATASVWREINDTLGKDSDFGKKWESYLAAKDMKGALKLAAGARKKVMDGIATRVGRTVYGQPTPAKSAPVKQAARTAPVRTSEPVDGFDAIWAR